ncbi:hypothetical protein Tco_1406289 [Tanacetum coccineum]
MDINTSVNVNSSVAMNDSVNYVEICNKCLELEAELIKQHNMVEKDEYNRLSKSFSKLEQHCISLELAMQLNKEIFQKNNIFVNQTKPLFDQLFELNNLKAELQAKDTTIEKLKANIKRLNKTSTTNNVKKDIDEIETINIELEHRVTKLIAENEHLKQTYKKLYDSIKPSRVQAKEHAELLGNSHILPKHTMEQAAILREIVEQAKSLNPLDSASYYACKYVKLIQELLGYVRDNCPDIHKPSEKLVAVMPINKKKTIRLAEPVISSSTSKKQLGSSQINTKQTTNNSVSTSTGVSRSTKSSSSKTKSLKKAKRKKNGKPTGKVFTKIGYNWRPTGKTFTLVGNVCPLTRITATNKVPLREPIPLEVIAQKSIVTKIYTKRPKVPKTNGSNSKPKIAKSVISNKRNPVHLGDPILQLLHLLLLLSILGCPNWFIVFGLWILKAHDRISLSETISHFPFLQVSLVLSSSVTTRLQRLWAMVTIR